MCRSREKPRYLGILWTRRTKYTEIYRGKLPGAFERFAPRPGMIIAKVTPTFVVTFVRNPDRRYLEHLDLENRTAYVFEEL
jgi:hypothetical protein